MTDAMDVLDSLVVTVSDPPQPASKLLQLPAAALDLVLQQLDPCSLASCAVSCSKLRETVPAYFKNVAARCSTVEAYTSLMRWLDRNGSCLTNLTYCGVVSSATKLPCPHLRQLHLHSMVLKFQSSASAADPNPLHHCTGLTALHLQDCLVDDRQAASAAIAALTQLQNLAVEGSSTNDGWLPLTDIGRHQQLTYLSLRPAWHYDARQSDGVRYDIRYDWEQQLSQVTALVNLQHLKLDGFEFRQVSDGFLKQLAKLTFLDIGYGWNLPWGSHKQFEHLSCLTALQHLAISNGGSEDFTFIKGFEHLPQLTSLQLQCRGNVYSTNETKKWARATALERLALEDGGVSSDALAELTQLRALRLHGVYVQNDLLADLLDCVRQLTLLTELYLLVSDTSDEDGAFPQAAAFTALTASTHLCSLQLRLSDSSTKEIPDDWILFRPDTTYPHLRVIDLHYAYTPGSKVADALPLTEQQLCSSCPAVQSLVSSLRLAPSATACTHLLQLSALTQLRLERVSGAAVAAGALAIQHS